MQQWWVDLVTLHIATCTVLYMVHRASTVVKQCYYKMEPETDLRSVNIPTAATHSPTLTAMTTMIVAASPASYFTHLQFISNK